MLNQKKYGILFLLVVFVAAFLAYLNVFNGEFIFDDAISIEDNPKIKDFSFFKSLGLDGYLKNTLSGGVPLTNLTFAVNYSFGGFHPFGYHVTNFLIHLANILLVYVLIYKTLKLLKSPYSDAAHWIAFLTVVFFGLHPIQTGAVSYISQRSEILAAFFYLLGLLLFIRGLSDNSLKGHFSYLGGIICFLIGIGTKDTIITLPLMAFVYWIYFLRQQADLRFRIVKIGLLSIPAVLVIFYRISAVSRDTRIGFGLEFGPYEYFLTQLRVISKYISLLIMPIGQNADYDFGISKGLADPPSTFFSFVFFLFLVILIVFLYRRWKIGSFALVWFFTLLAPTSSFIPIIDVIFEHRVYLPSAGIFLLFSLGLYHAFKLLKASHEPNKLLIVLTVFVLIGSLIYATTSRNMVWTNRISFWEDVAGKSPKKARVYVSLGSAYQERGLTDFAVAAYTKATNLADVKEKPNSMLALALLYSEMGKNGEAITEMKKALSLDPINSADQKYLVGTVYEKADLIEEAMKSYKEALTRDARFHLARYALGSLYERQGFHAAALAEYKEILKISPNTAAAFNRIGIVYAKMKDIKEAERNFQSALKIDPLFSPASTNLKILAKSNRRTR